MKKFYIIGMILGVCAFLSSCNDEWKDELYRQMISFKAPVGSNGICDIYVRYQPNGKVTYKLPVIVSGSRDNARDIDVVIGVDNDTLYHLNSEKFPVGRQDLWYQQLPETFYSFPSNVCHIPAGTNVETYSIDFDLSGLDMNEKWVLPLTIEDSSDYVQNKRKGWYKALLGINLYNDYSGTYSASQTSIYIEGSHNDPALVDNRVTRVVDENSIFFYAGSVWEEDEARSKYKVIATLGEGTADEEGTISGPLTLRAGDPDSGIDFEQIGDCTYERRVMKHETIPYLERHITTLRIHYKYSDFTSNPNRVLRYEAVGSMTMERKINTLIPDDDQAIQW